jgi:hypothetical protein
VENFPFQRIVYSWNWERNQCFPSTSTWCTRKKTQQCNHICFTNPHIHPTILLSPALCWKQPSLQTWTVTKFHLYKIMVYVSLKIHNRK